MELRYTKRDLPPIAREFYARLKEGEFTVSRCGECGRQSFPPRELCLECGAADSALVPHSGEGTLYAFSTQERALRFSAPSVIGLVDLDGNAGRGFGVIAGSFEDLSIGQQMRLAPVTVEDDWALPGWEPREPSREPSPVRPE